MLLDYINIVVNIFCPEKRNYYNIEKDLQWLHMSEDFNSKQLGNNWQFKSIGCDVNDIHWKYRDEGEDVKPGNEYFIAGTTNATSHVAKLLKKNFNNLSDNKKLKNRVDTTKGY